MEICVNDYVRTRYGIAKVIDIEENPNKEKTIYVLDKDIISVEETEHGTFYIITHPFEEIMINKFDTHFGDEKQITKHSKNIIDLIEDEDIVILEYKSPKYRERITRRFEVSKIDDDISFENAHCNFRCKIGDKKIKDNICKNIKIKSVVTKEQFKNIEYIVEE